MANVSCVFVKLCVLFSIILNVSNSKEIQNSLLYNKYEVIGNLQPLATHEATINLREKRELNAKDSTTVINSSTIAPSTKSLENDSVNQTQTINLENNTRLLGANGTGQRKDVISTVKPTIVSEPLNSSGTKLTKGLTSINSDNINGTTTTIAAATSTTSPSTIVEELPTDEILGEVDITGENINKTIHDHLKNGTYNVDYYQYYNSTTIVDKKKSKEYWSNLNNFTVSNLLSKSHRRAITVHLSFDFPFYGHPVRNVTVATGGFLYTGEYVHSWLAATQYIAPLMANFDTSISNDSIVKYSDNGTVFTVVWENVSLQEHHNDGLFTFSVSLHNSGDITFAYQSVPISISKIVDDKHPVKIGLSDAYIIDKTIYFARRKTIYEYHRVNFNSNDIKNDTFIYLTALPTCLDLTDCVSCVNNTILAFNCSWCPGLLRCSTGTDRKKQLWIQNGCEQTRVTEPKTCPALGTKGNNYASQQQVKTPDVINDRWTHGGTENANASNVSPEVAKAALSHANDNDAKRSGAGFVIGLLLPIVVVMSLVVWVFYAYRNPHTKSGQLLIQYRPSQWAWRRGEARYTAATIHM